MILLLLTILYVLSGFIPLIIYEKIRFKEVTVKIFTVTFLISLFCGCFMWFALIYFILEDMNDAGWFNWKFNFWESIKNKKIL